MKKFSTYILVLLIIFIASCNNKQQKNSNNPDNSNDSSVVTKTLKDLTVKWNDCHIKQDLSTLATLFSEKVSFYGSSLHKEKVISNKEEFFKKHPDFHQQIIGNIQTEKLSDSTIKCSFIKRVTLNQVTKDYPSYLTFKKAGNEWKITAESDLITDKNLSKKSISKNEMPNDAVKGDYDGDGTMEYMWLVKPEINEENMDCNGDCFCYIKFSGNKIPSIKVEGCIDGSPVNEGDLNKNGTDEVGMVPDWFTSCWHSYHVWTFIKGKWIDAVKPFSVYICNEEDEGKPIEIDKKKEGYVIIRYNDMGEDLETKTKSVKIAR